MGIPERTKRIQFDSCHYVWEKIPSTAMSRTASAPRFVLGLLDGPGWSAWCTPPYPLLFSVLNQFEALRRFSGSDFEDLRLEKFGEKIVFANSTLISRVRTCAKSVCDWYLNSNTKKHKKKPKTENNSERGHKRGHYVGHVCGHVHHEPATFVGIVFLATLE